ncbi:hypothetical protein QV08_00985, partial [Gallibacterium salpingitidis]|uniref:hypothetical protein n=1 Tax=Gallibacterium salpingitidis TaxID=505341 RepID=UPI000804E33B
STTTVIPSPPFPPVTLALIISSKLVLVSCIAGFSAGLPSTSPGLPGSPGSPSQLAVIIKGFCEPSGCGHSAAQAELVKVKRIAVVKSVKGNLREEENNKSCVKNACGGG